MKPKLIKCFAHLMLFGLLGLITSVQALELQILDAQGEPLSGVVVSAPDVSSATEASEMPFEMTQRNRQFDPHVLVIPRGAEVVFPNQDSIKHHVYSFSSAKRFQLRLYKDEIPDPLVFDQSGVVEIGCNVHDWMLAYIYVIDPVVYGITDSNGRVELPLADGEMELELWHSRMTDTQTPERQQVILADQTRVTLQRSLKPELKGFDSGDEFDSYD